MTTEEVINILQNIDPQCQNDCPISRDDCAKQENKCLVSEALEYAVDFLSAGVQEGVSVRLAIEPGLGVKCPNCNSILSRTDYYFCPWCGSEILGIDFGKWEYKKE